MSAKSTRHIDITISSTAVQTQGKYGTIRVQLGRTVAEPTQRVFTDNVRAAFAYASELKAQGHELVGYNLICWMTMREWADGKTVKLS